MEDAKAERIREIAVDCLSGTWLRDNGDGTFTCELYADYRDEMSNEAAIKIITNPDPLAYFHERLSDWYFDPEYCTREELREKVSDALRNSGEFSEEEVSDLSEYLDELIYELVFFEYPEDHYLKQKFLVDIMVDTGDGNYDYTLNPAYPHWSKEKGEMIDNKAAIVWLAKTQGYGKSEMRRELEKGDVRDPDGFLQSLRQELANLPSQMAVLTFLVEMSLGELIELNKGIRLQERNGHFYDATKIPHCGYIVLDKRTETGLYDPWSGGGSVFEIQLEKDVRLPIRFIRSALPDGGDGRYSVESVYGMCHSVWRSEMVKEIHLPKNA